MKNLRFSLATLALTLVAVGCGSIQTRSKDEAALSNVKKVAVVAFSETEPASRGIGLDLGSGKLGGTDGGTMIPQKGPHVDSMFDELIGSFSTRMKWSVMDKKSMLRNAGYTEAYNKTMKGFQNKMPPGSGMKQYIVDNIMDYDSPRILDVSGRDALITALGVDAIVVARVDVILHATTVMGIGSRYPQSRLSFMMYRKGEPKPIWFEGAVDGEKAGESVGKTGFIDEGLLGQLALKSAKTAFAKIGDSVVR